MRMGQGVRTGLGHGGITCVLQTQFSSLDGDVPRSTYYGVNSSELIQFAGVSSHVTNFNARNKIS